MKRILITGTNSYVGNSFKNYVAQWPDEYQIDTISLRDGTWREKNFGGYDSIFHVAGIAHSDTGHASKKTKSEYYRINTDLTIEVAAKAKQDGVKQFIFMSSIIVYGDSAPIGKKKVITKDTVPCPSNFYGDSKLRAENGITPLNDESFHVVIIRAPMIYGKGSKGNYTTLAIVAQMTPVFPNIDNERSMLHIDNLCEFIKAVIDQKDKGMFFPQNQEYVQTSRLVNTIAVVNGKKIWLTKLFNPVLVLMFGIGIVNKVFGSLVYDQSMSIYEKANYQMYHFQESIIETEIGNRNERK